MHPNTTSRLLGTLSRQPGRTAEGLLRRLRLQIEFGNAFAGLLSDRATAEGWLPLLAQASDSIDALRPDSLGDLEAAVTAAESLLAPIGVAAKEYTVTCVGHGHIDMNWMWSWPETVSATHDTFASVLSLMRQYPDLTYSQSQASVYALIEKYHPAMFEEIRERVKEGRWEVTAVHWVEGDKNLASGESLARHLLYTRRYFAEKFGLSAEKVPLDWEPDTFGHANTIPTILAQGGVRFYYGCRLGGGFDHAVVGDFPRPRLFRWEGPDGSRLLVNRESTWYNSYVNIGDNIALPAIGFYQETGLKDWLNIYGLGNHGGGPTRTEIDYFLELRTWPIYPNVVFGTATAWFEQADRAENLPVIDHELNYEFTGCYTSQSLIKQANRFGENYLVEAETLAAITHVAPDTKARLREGWLNVLFNQFHDILPGSGVRQTREHATALFQEAGAITGSIKREAGKALVAEIDTLSLLPETPEAEEERRLAEVGRANTPFVAGAGIGAMETGYSVASGGGVRFKPFVLYNPCAWERSEPVTVVLYDTDLDPGRIVARDENGVNHPTLALGTGEDWGHRKITVLFLAQNVPALGYKTYVLCEGRADGDAAPRVSLQPQDRFETPFLRFQALRALSGIRGVTDKRTDATLQSGYDALGVWRYLVERPRGMTAWVLGNEIEARVSLRSVGYHIHGASRNQGTAYPQGDNIAYLVQQHLEVPGTRSTVRLSTLVHGLEPRVDVTAEIDWREIGDSGSGIPGLAVDFAYDLTDAPAVRYETPFGSVLRFGPDAQEVPSLRYAHLSGEVLGEESSVPCGITLLQDCKYGHTVGPGNNLRLRMIRSSFDPDHAPEVCRQRVRYSLFFHEGEADPATLTRLGAAWNHPLIVFPADLQTGSGSPSASFARVEPANVVLSALKPAEEGDGTVLRLVEYGGEDTEATVLLADSLVGGKATAEIVDLMERPTGATATLTGNRLSVSVPANSFVTVRLS
ncbi:MAG: glycoside hydrolase family 38 C-terminal domain-containing protein [Capsulimonadales bacterium]|nr:glycoside hydrolase family 38 C-terminal domain-containing protein [Capsulimonadales bacterium]